MVFNTIRKHPIVCIPFFISGVLKLIGLAFVFLSIFYPLSIVCAPIIRTLWGEQFLHYPFNFFMMPRLFYYVQIAVYILIDGLLSGAAVWMVFQINEGKRVSFMGSIKKVLPKYLTLAGFLLTIFLIVYGVSYMENLVILKLLKVKIVAALANRGLLDFIQAFLNFFLIALIEIVFAYVIQFTVLENKRYFRSIAGSFTLMKKFFITTFLLVAVPALLSLPFTLLKTGLRELIDVTVPEITLLVLGISTIIVVLVDCYVTVSLTFLFLSRKDLDLERLR